MFPLYERFYKHDDDQLLRLLNSPILFDGNDKLFKKELSHVDYYGEFGCGQSTIYANNIAKKNIITAETDNDWVSLINSQLEKNDKHTSVSINYIDLGITGNWGRPIDYAKRDNFITYQQFFNDKQVELVLIDGRFRVACFLQLYTYFKNSLSIIFDDYVTRTEYHIVEELLKPSNVNERQALFELPIIDDRLNINLALSLLPKFEYVMT